MSARRILRLACLSLLLGLLLAALPTTKATAATTTAFEVILDRSSAPQDIGRLDGLPWLKGLSVVVVQESRQGHPDYVLKIGRFASFAEARAVMRRLAEDYPQAHAERIEVAVEPVRPADLVMNEVDEARLHEWLDAARQALQSGDLASADSYLSRIVELAPAASPARPARELLGLLRERQGQPEQAAAVYEDFLRHYPKGEDSERVRQRLQTLREARMAERKPLSTSRSREKRKTWLGSLSQFVTRDVSYVDGDSMGATSMLITDVDLSGRYDDGRYAVRTQLDLNHRRVFEGHTRDRDRLRLNALYLDIQDRRLRGSLTIGRQRHSSSGILGRFDGLLLGYQRDSAWHFNAVIGRPADINDTSESDRLLYGMSVDGGTFARRWDVNAYLIRQTADGMTDREALGGELRYALGQQSHLALFDYDLNYRTVNDALLDTRWFRTDGTTLNASLAYRAAPLLVTENALIGQGEASIGALLQRLSEDEIRQLARDRTAHLHSLTLGASRPFHEHWQLSADFSMNHVSGTPASGGVDAVPSTGTEYFYSLQATGNGLLRSDDIGTFILSYSDLAANDILSLDFDGRYPVNAQLRAEPRLGIDYRSSETGFDTLTLRPTLRADYSWRRNIALDAEIGLVWSDELAANGGTSLDLSFEIGYRLDF